MGEGLDKLKESIRGGVQFFKEAWQELKKVHWPSRKETYAATVVVIIVVILAALLLAVVDYGLTWAIQQLLG